MSYKENIVVVLFNPPISCIEQVLEFLSGFKGVSSKLHILNDLDSNKKMVSEEDLLILELSMPVLTSRFLIKYVNNLYPSLEKVILDKSQGATNNELPFINTNKGAVHLSLKNPDFYLN